MRSLLKLFALAVLAVLTGAGWLWNEYQSFLNEPVLTVKATHRIMIPPGQSFSSIVARLPIHSGEQGTRLLEFHARRTGKAGLLKAGEYDLRPAWTPDQLLDHLISGKVVQHSLTIVEGHTFEQLMAQLRRNDVLRRQLDGLSSAEVMVRIGQTGLHPEGQFLPDTYYFPRGATDVAFLRRAHLALRRYLDQAWPQRAPDLPLKSPQEALVLASIIEKETGVAKERPEIAGVFVRRLRKNMRLETDPTVIYGMGAAFDGNLRRADLRRDTPYNTYTRKGLPPTPIALAGARAIDAALHPRPGTSLYFVSKGDGSHQFSATYAAHLRAVRRYQLKGRKPARKAASR